MFNKFNYLAPASLKETFDILKEKKDAHILAGGTDLIVNIRSGKISPHCVVDLKKIKSLGEIKKTKTGIEIGSIVNMNELGESKLLTGAYSLLKYAASIMGCYEIRNRATIGGNIINASPGAETLTPLTVLEAKVVLKSSRATRTLPVGKFITWVNTTAIKKDELLTKIVIPFYPKNTAGFYMRRQRVKGMDLASVNCAILVLNPDNIKTRKVRIAMGTVLPTPYRAKKAEKLLSNCAIDADRIKRAARIIKDEIAPRASSLRATPEYKKLMIESFLMMGLKKILGEPLR